ncbi:MAG: FHA domain-containing protein, partial [Planctomycetota bacterium]
SSLPEIDVSVTGFDVPEMELVTPVEDEGWDDEGALFGEAADEEVAVEAPAAEDDSQGAPSEEHATAASFALEIYHDTEARVVHTHPVVNDITLIGREDPHRDIFPDLDLGKLADDGVSAQHVSRQHLRLLRQGERCYLFIYKGTTGTQVCKEVIEPSRYGKRFEINVGDRIILGGKVRMKLTAGEPDA